MRGAHPQPLSNNRSKFIEVPGVLDFDLDPFFPRFERLQLLFQPPDFASLCDAH